MTAYHATALRTAPLFLFSFQKYLQAILFNKAKIFDHAQVIFGAISLIQRFKPFAGKILAFIAKPNLPFAKQFTFITHVSTVFPSRNTARAVFPVKSMLIKIIFHELISKA